MKRAEKEVVVNQLSEKFSRAQAVLLAEYRGLKVSELTELRREVKRCEGDFRVVKNRLAKRTLVSTGVQELTESFKGPVGVAFAFQDPVVMVKVLTRFAESYGLFKLKIGFLGGKVLSAKEIVSLSRLPGREELFAKLLGTLQAPIGNVVRALRAVPQKLAGTIKEIEKSKGGN